MIFKSSTLKDAVRDAQGQAARRRDTGETVGWIEHGGWILWKRGTRNKFSYLVKEPRHFKNSPRGYEYTDTSVRVWLHDAPTPPEGWEIVAIFHLHINDTGPHDGDTVSADAVKVPGFLGQPDGQIFKVSSLKRGIFRRDLPKRCLK